MIKCDGFGGFCIDSNSAGGRQTGVVYRGCDCGFTGGNGCYSTVFIYGCYPGV